MDERHSGGAIEAECVVPGGDIGDVAELIKGLVEGKGFDMVVACVGEVSTEKIIYGCNVKPGDVVVGLRSSGIHSNGVTLARRVLFKCWGGRYDPFDVPEPLDRELVYEFWSLLGFMLSLSCELQMLLELRLLSILRVMHT